MRTLHKVVGCGSHIVAQIVEAKLVVSTESDVCFIRLATLQSVRLVLIDAIHRQAVEHIQRTHPLGVALCEVVVDGHHVNTIAGKGIEEHRESSHECLTFTGSHLGNLALMEHNAADELHIIVHHIPNHLIATCHPAIFIDSFIAVDSDKIFALSCEFAVEVGGRHFNSFITGKSTCCLSDESKHFGKIFIKLPFKDIENIFFDVVDFRPIRLALVVVNRFDRFFDIDNLLSLIGNTALNGVAYLSYLATQIIVGEPLKSGVNLIDFCYNRLNLPQVTLRLVAEHFFKEIIESHNIIFLILFKQLSPTQKPWRTI